MYVDCLLFSTMYLELLFSLLQCKQCTEHKRQLKFTLHTEHIHLQDLVLGGIADMHGMQHIAYTTTQSEQK
jgi:hypothetical protein